MYDLLLIQISSPLHSARIPASKPLELSKAFERL
jgi:hypothetical protein